MFDFVIVSRRADQSDDPAACRGVITFSYGDDDFSAGVSIFKIPNGISCFV